MHYHNKKSFFKKNTMYISIQQANSIAFLALLFIFMIQVVNCTICFDTVKITPHGTAADFGAGENTDDTELEFYLECALQGTFMIGSVVCDTELSQDDDRTGLICATKELVVSVSNLGKEHSFPINFCVPESLDEFECELYEADHRANLDELLDSTCRGRFAPGRSVTCNEGGASWMLVNTEDTENGTVEDQETNDNIVKKKKKKSKKCKKKKSKKCKKQK